MFRSLQCRPWNRPSSVVHPRMLNYSWTRVDWHFIHQSAVCLAETYSIIFWNLIFSGIHLMSVFWEFWTPWNCQEIPSSLHFGTIHSGFFVLRDTPNHTKPSGFHGIVLGSYKATAWDDVIYGVELQLPRPLLCILHATYARASVIPLWQAN